MKTKEKYIFNFKKYLFAILIMLSFIFVLNDKLIVNADTVTNNGYDYNTTINVIQDKKIENEDVYKRINSRMERIWGTVTTIFQIASFLGICLAGIRYMFASADTRADIKNSLISLVIGMVIVFSASTIVKFIVSASNEILQ